MKKQKRTKSGEERALKFALFHNGLFKHKVIKNKKKEAKKFNFKKEMDSYLSTYIYSKYLNKNPFKIFTLVAQLVRASD